MAHRHVRCEYSATSIPVKRGISTFGIIPKHVSSYENIAHPLIGGFGVEYRVITEAAHDEDRFRRPLRPPLERLLNGGRIKVWVRNHFNGELIYGPTKCQA